VLVLYGPVGDLAPPIERLATVVGRVLIVDNNQTPLPGLADALPDLPVTVLHNANHGGVAGAYNLALRHLQLQHPDEPHAVVFLDQDSDADSLGGFLADAAVQDLLGRDDVAAVSPAYCERSTGLRGRYIELGRWRVHHLPRRFAGARPVAFVINSMTIWRSEALRRIGNFNETLAIDHVDTEYCLRARQLRLAVWVHGDHEFAHAIGQRRRYRLLGRDLQAGGHSPERRRFIGRNTTLLARTWFIREPAFGALCLMRLAYEVTGIVMAEDDKLAKLAAFARGVFQGLFMPGRA
jgi:rhamnosyltransferase